MERVQVAYSKSRLAIVANEEVISRFPLRSVDVSINRDRITLRPGTGFRFTRATEIRPGTIALTASSKELVWAPDFLFAQVVVRHEWAGGWLYIPWPVQELTKPPRRSSALVRRPGYTVPEAREFLAMVAEGDEQVMTNLLENSDDVMVCLKKLQCST